MNHLLTPKAIGVYQIKNVENGYSYIGSAANLRKRCIQHVWDLNNKKHCNPQLQKVWNKYGGDVFRFYVLEELETTEALLEREQFFLDTLLPEYNVCPIAGSAKGRVPTPEHRENLRQSLLGKRHSEERRRVNREASLKKYAERPDIIERIRLSLTGKKQSDETKRKRAETARKNRRERSWLYPNSVPPRPVAQYSLDGQLIARFGSAYEAAQSTNATNILKICNGIIMRPKKFIWRYDD